MVQNEDTGLVWEGIKLIWVVMGFIGAALGVSTLPPMGPKQLFFAATSGIVCAAFAPQWAGFMYLRWMGDPIPAFMNNTIAFIFGIGGMFIVPGLITLWRGFKDNPWGWVQKIAELFGYSKKGPPPPPDTGIQGGD